MPERAQRDIPRSHRCQALKDVSKPDCASATSLTNYAALGMAWLPTRLASLIADITSIVSV
jgi:hypothetical protein